MPWFETANLRQILSVFFQSPYRSIVLSTSYRFPPRKQPITAREGVRGRPPTLA